jgi:hypothetical protein
MRIADDPACWSDIHAGNMSAVAISACDMFHRRFDDAGQLGVSELEKPLISS